MTNVRFGFSNADAEARWSGLKAFYEHWLGPPTEAALPKLDDIAMPEMLRRYHQFIGCWTDERRNRPYGLLFLPPEELEAEQAVRSDNRMTFASDEQGIARFVTSVSGFDPPAFCVTDLPEEKLVSSSLADALDYLTFQQLTFAADQFGGARALQPAIADGSLSSEVIEFEDMSYSPRTLLLVEGEVLMDGVDRNGRAFGLVGVRPGHLGKWRSLVDGEPTGAQFWAWPTRLDVKGNAYQSRWEVDINPNCVNGTACRGGLRGPTAASDRGSPSVRPMSSRVNSVSRGPRCLT